MSEAIDRAMSEAARHYGRVMADQVADYVNQRVELALRLEQDRIDSELAELRDELHSIAVAPAIADSTLSQEVRLLNDRMTRMGETVAGLMRNDTYSVRVEQ